MNPHVARKLRVDGWKHNYDATYSKWAGSRPLWSINQPTRGSYWRLFLWAGGDWTELSRHRTLLAAMAAADGVA